MDYKFIVIPFVALLIAQLIKFTIESIRYGRIRFTRLFNGSGGMPSTHTAFITSMAMCMGLEFGFDSAIFAMALVISLIVCYDAIGVRWETGQQATTINRLVSILDLHKGLQDEMDEFKKLKEEVGHRPLEVFGGLIVGILTAISLF